MKGFQVAGGRVPGRQHLTSEANTQDGLCFIDGENAIVAVVCDGCSSGLHNEVGALLAAPIVSHCVMQHMHVAAETGALGPQEVELMLDETRRHLLLNIKHMARAMGGKFHHIVNDYFLFTIVGMLVTQSVSAVFWIGDGIYIINGNVVVLKPQEGNQPVYAAYDLLDSSLVATKPELLGFQFRCFTTEGTKSLLIGTDGVSDFIAAENLRMPGKEELVGPVSQFWTDDRYFRNPDSIRRRLALANRSVAAPDWSARMMRREAGHLPDDTTIVVVRRVCLEM